MNGVDIQYVESLVVSNNIRMGLFITAIILVLIIGGIALAICIEDEEWVKALCVLVLSLSLIGIFVYGLNKVSNRPDKNYYVTVDENVCVIQFYDKYDVIKRKGDIWIVQDKITD